MFKINWEKTSSAQISKEIIYEMVKLAFPNNRLVSYEIIAGGCANINVKIDLEGKAKPLILRIYIRDKGAAYREQKLALLLENIIPIATSHYIGDTCGYRFAIIDYFPGITLRELLLSKASDLGSIMQDVGTILSKIASIEFKEPGFFDYDLNIIQGITDPIDYARECLEDSYIQPILQEKTIEGISKYLEKSSFPQKHEKQLVHGDFDPANILVTETDGKWKVSGVLDWEFAFSGSFLWDIANMLRYAHKMPCEFQDSFINALTINGKVLPSNWQEIIKLLNLISLLDCLKRSENKPNQYADVIELIGYILKS